MNAAVRINGVFHGVLPFRGTRHLTNISCHDTAMLVPTNFAQVKQSWAINMVGSDGVEKLRVLAEANTLIPALLEAGASDFSCAPPFDHARLFQSS